MSAKETDITNIGVIILAAGASSRLGRPKQMLLYKGETLLQHATAAALTSDAAPVIVVLGAGAEALQKEISGKNIHLVVNTDWNEGMASSIRGGITKLNNINPKVEGVILMVCDQPFVSGALLNDLIAAYKKTGRPVVACSYEATFGPPVLFHRSLFQELLQLKGDIGARSVVKQHADAVEIIPFAEGIFDVDTEKDYERIKTAGKQ